jgi:L-malate glycosyltransferase
VKRILVLSPYPEGFAASQRLKYEQYYGSWKNAGYDITTSSFFDLPTWKVLYVEGEYLKKFLGTFLGYFKRLKDLCDILKFDIIYIHLWATPIGPPIYEFILLMLGKKIIYDFDDALFEKPDYFSVVNFLKGNFKAKYLIKNSHHLVLSSPFLLNHCLEKNIWSEASYIPCSLDTKRFHLREPSEWSEKIILGWTGTFSSKAYLDSIKDVFYELDKHFPIKIVLITNFDYCLEGLDLEIVRWSEPSEVEDLHQIDIGVYPLIQTSWALGKGGLKALQYMAAGIPAVATDFGTVKDFIIHKENGLLVNTKEEWVDAIKLLIENPMLRKNIIINARKTVERSYSVTNNKNRYLSIFENLLTKD